MELFNTTDLSKLLDWVAVEKAAPPGPPPRPGLVWRERTSRWIRPREDAGIRDGPETTDALEVASPEDPSISTPIDLDPAKVQEISDYISTFQSAFDSCLSYFSTLFPDGEITGRLKESTSAYDKTQKKGVDIEALTDIAGTRVEFSDSQDVKKAVDTVKEHFRILEEEEHYKKDGYYTATHMLIEVEGKTIEVQLRTTANGKIADYSHDRVYKEAAVLAEDPALLDYVNQYLGAWSDFVGGQSDRAPTCPEPVRLIFSCLEDVVEGDVGEDAEEGAEVSLMERASIPKIGNEDYEIKAKALFERLRAPKGHFRLVLIDALSDSFEADTVIDDFIFLEEAQKEKLSLAQENAEVDYLIYDESLKVVG